MADESCAVFGRLDGNLDPKKIHRFIVGLDATPRPMTADEAKELGDPFATLLLRNGIFPATAEACLEQIDKAAKPNSQLRRHMSFLLGETSQIPTGPNAARLRRNIRFVVTRGSDGNGPPDGPDILLSVSSADQSDIELMAWDRRRGGFNFYRAVGAGPTWVFAGNASRALADPTQGKGPFESHKSGAFLMKELKLPWQNWHSPEAPIGASAFPKNDPRLKHPWFTKKEPGGAYTFELAVARPAIERWAKARFDALAAAGTIEHPGRIMEQILGTPTANLASSNVESRRAISSKVRVDVPPSFFVDVDGLAIVGLTVPGFLFEVAPDVYAKTLKRFKVRIDDDQGFVQEGDTHFAFAVPERAFEDVVVLREAMRIGLITRRLAACLLMVDFQNPIFSRRREKLLEHVPKSAAVKNRRSRFSRAMADAILKAAEDSDEGSPEREFAALWKTGDDFEARFNRSLKKYFGAAKKLLATQNGFDDYWRLAHARRAQARENPVFKEFELVFPKSDVAKPARRMRADGTVV
jgi:hypothetical protein